MSGKPGKTGVIEAAVFWWADKLYSCKQSGLSAEERRDPKNYGYQMAEMFMTLGKPKVSTAQVETFKKALTALMDKDLPHFLGVDYSPDHILNNALLAAGIEIVNGVLPIKTRMWITDSKVDVQYGYGAPVETIYPAREISQCLTPSW